MPKILIKSKDPSIIDRLNRNKKPGYELVPVSVEAPFDMISAENKDIHGVIADCDLITHSEVIDIKEKMNDRMFPVVILADELSEEDAGKWISCGVSDIFLYSTPSAVMAKRMGAVIQLYCVTQSLHGQVTDKLTGLCNKNAFYHFAKEMMMKGPEDSYFVIMSDIENFKRINERYGEEKGDELLRYVGNILSSFNNENALFARYSGDQFVGIMRSPGPGFETDEKFFRESMQKLYDEAPIEHFSVQFGIYEDVDKSLPVSIMCDRALMALKTIKHKYGRSMAKYTSQLQMSFAREQQILDNMEQAITENQFQIYYQPKHDAMSSEIIGAEALVRWYHPQYGFLSPGEFIPIFERNGFISRLDEYVWNKVCSQLKLMIENGIPVVPVSVNASRMDFLAEGYAESLNNSIEKNGLDSKLLHLELTESAYMKSAGILAPVISRIKEYGIKIELDDFGSGFSSLGNIASLPVDIIKLDIGLVRNVEAQPIIIESIIHMMHSLGYKVTAEGVENDRQQEILRNMNCDYIQGYYFSKPLPMEGFCNYLEMNQ